MVIHYNDDFTEMGVYKLSDYTDALAEEHKIHTEDEEAEFTVAALKEAAEKVATPVTDSTEKTSGEEVDAKQGDAEKIRRKAAIRQKRQKGRL